MIKKLRRKFIIINMTLISIVLVIVFSLICVSTYDRLKNESYQVLYRVLDSKDGMRQPPLEIGPKPNHKAPPMLPIFSVFIGSAGTISSVSQENVVVTDEVIEQVTQRVLAIDKQDGILFDLKLRFLKQQTHEGTKIVFVDITREFDTMTNLLLVLLLVGLGGLIAFFWISVFLAGWALRPVEKAWEQQRQFVSDASHELKTPLTVILTNTDILLSHRDDKIEQQAKWVEYIKAEAHRMKKLVDDLLFLAKQDSGQSTPPHTSLNLSDVVWNSLLPLEPIAYEKGIEISSEIASDIEIIGDEGQLKQLVVILLDNACKYTAEGGTVTVKLERNKELVSLSVHNTGEPIDQHHLEHIFKRFYRGESSRARDLGGYGLGLSIAKTIVDQHKGIIHVESDRARGTTFTVSFFEGTAGTTHYR